MALTHVHTTSFYWIELKALIEESEGLLTEPHYDTIGHVPDI